LKTEELGAEKLNVVLGVSIEIFLIMKLQDCGVLTVINAGSSAFFEHIQKGFSAGSEAYRATKTLHWCEQETA
jgi:hypothetical protein